MSQDSVHQQHTRWPGRPPTHQQEARWLLCLHALLIKASVQTLPPALPFPEGFGDRMHSTPGLLAARAMQVQEKTPCLPSDGPVPCPRHLQVFFSPQIQHQIQTPKPGTDHTCPPIIGSPMSPAAEPASLAQLTCAPAGGGGPVYEGPDAPNTAESVCLSLKI